jgi:hypothetical protein
MWIEWKIRKKCNEYKWMEMTELNRKESKRMKWMALNEDE